MGVTLHYRGKLKSPSLIEPLISEVSALAKESGWRCLLFGPEPYEIFDRISTTLRGIKVQVHPACEMLSLLFDEQGRLISLAGLELVAAYGFIVESEDELGKIITMEMPPPEKLAQLTWDVLANMGEIKTAFTKTQFAGAETHILLCKLLRYLEKKYFAELEVIDEGDYYYKGDASALAEKLAFLNFIIDNAGKELSEAPLKPLSDQNSLDDYLQDLTRYLQTLANKAPIKPKF